MEAVLVVVVGEVSARRVRASVSLIATLPLGEVTRTLASLDSGEWVLELLAMR